MRMLRGSVSLLFGAETGNSSKEAIHLTKYVSGLQSVEKLHYYPQLIVTVVTLLTRIEHFDKKLYSDYFSGRTYDNRTTFTTFHTVPFHSFGRILVAFYS